VGRNSVRSFAASAPRGVREPPPPPQRDAQDGTTHFGFETVAEALKEQRGMQQHNLLTRSERLD
jgi:2-methoxy-6-polyprenyl-1,4-benzoquinol methylase